MIRLLFPLAEVLALAEHAIAAAGHKPSFSNHFDGTTPVPALWFVGDEGLYLMSNGLPAQPHPTEAGRLHVVYARGYQTSMSKHAISHAIGGDDFCQVLALLDPQPGGTLHARLAAGTTDGMTLFIIDLDQTAMELVIAGDGEVAR